MTKLDAFTLGILCNAEVIEVDQDPLGRQGRPVVQDEATRVLAKPMEDGSLAVGLFNLEEDRREAQGNANTRGRAGKKRQMCAPTGRRFIQRRAQPW